jgi:HPt (histidine-containing phosphotransfer) domain-containing protein
MSPESSGNLPISSAPPLQHNAIANFRKLRETIDNNQDLFNEIVQAFLEDYPPLLQGIKEGLVLDNSELVRRNAHTLKGQVGIFAADRARQAAAIVEELAGQAECKVAAEELYLALNELYSAISSYEW